ncbi:RNA polymerase sigma factor [Parasediminibacterium sp. JCM 36343]|uniref:RNA polymerase sigma factor n=1 Tax=Parasediminibacterium sp. JCM 36343 TaxID=3374279 RepID=UPI00397B93B8
MPTDKYQHITDEELLNKFYVDGDSQWMGILLQRYTLLLLGVCMKYLKNEIEAQDAVQQVFLKAIIEVRKYKVAYFKSWLYMIAKNHCLVLLRHKNKIMLVEEGDLAMPAEETDLQALQNNEQTLTAMEICLPKLNEEQKTCLTLFYLERRSYQEVSAATGFDIAHVKSYIQNGKRNLKILVEKQLKQKA